MSRTNHSPPGNREYWGSRWRPYAAGPGRLIKQQTHRKERREAQMQLRADPGHARKWSSF
jgi:hypothetical protein